MNKWMSLAVVAPIVWCSSAFASKAYDAGAEEARNDLKAEYAYVYTFGLRGAERYDLNETTGLPYRAIAGCIVDNDITDRARGYNETVQAWIKEHGKPPANSIKPYADQLKELPRFWATSADAPAALTQDPAKIDEAHTIKLNPVDERGYSTLVLKSDAGDVTHFLAVDPIRNVTFKPGPAGSRTVVVRFDNADGSVCYMVIETRRGAGMMAQTIRPDSK